MEILHNLWNVLCTEDENLIKYIIVFMNIIETYVTLKLFSNILEINYTKKQRNIYIVVMEILLIISTFFIPQQYAIFIHLFVTFIVIKIIFHTSLIKAILAEIIPMLVCTLLEIICLKVCFKLFGISIENYIHTIIYRVPYMLFIYLVIYLLSRLVKYIKLNINILEALDKTYKKTLTLNLILILIYISLQFYLIMFYNSTLPIFITLISLVFLIAYACISMYSIIKTINLELTKRNLEQAELHNKSLELLYNNVSAFKHDFSNIITALGGYINSRNMDGLEKYYDKILDECNINNNLSTLNPSIINNPAIYNILASKYYKADENGITINLQVFINLNELKLDVYDFCRILGILLDNAIEASSKCEEKIINIDIRDIKPHKCQSITIENTYLDKDIDISKLSEKGYTSKTEDKKSHGIGLWQVEKLVKKHNNIILDTTKDETYFRQELVIYY